MTKHDKTRNDKKIDQKRKKWIKTTKYEQKLPKIWSKITTKFPKNITKTLPIIDPKMTKILPNNDQKL